MFADPSSCVAAAIALVLAVTALPQVALTLWFAAVVRGRTRDFLARRAVRAEAAVVPAEVVLCLRGHDATLDDVLAALARQTHRAWRLRVVVDSVADPAWDATCRAVARLEAEEAASWDGHVIEPLAGSPCRGSLKCASLRQALASLAPETRVVALVDADSVVHPDWLVTMVDECLRPGVGAVSGNRWYAPDHAAAPAVVRTIWNAGAVVQMTAFGIPWGGSLAVRREAVEGSGWLDVIESSLCEDTALAAPLARSGWAYRYVPALTVVDRDGDVGLPQLARWISRQLLTARLHHPLWPLVALHGLVTSAVLVGGVAAGVVALCMGHSRSAAWIATGLVGYEAVSLFMAVGIAGAIRRAAAAAGTRVEPLTARDWLRWAALVPVTQAVYAAALAGALRARSVEWRGIVYDIRDAAAGGGVTIRTPRRLPEPVAEAVAS